MLASGRHSHKGHRGKRQKKLFLHTCCEFQPGFCSQSSGQNININYIKFYMGPICGLAKIWWESFRLLTLQASKKIKLPYRLGFSPQPQKYILVSHSRINPAPWKYLIYTNPAQGFLPDRLQNTPKIPVFQSRTPKINRYFSCAQSPRRTKNDIFAR